MQPSSLLDVFCADAGTRWDTVDCAPRAFGPTGEQFWLFGADGLRNEAEVLGQGAVFGTQELAEQSFMRAFAAFTLDKVGVLYWRLRPEVEFDTATAVYSVRARFVISAGPIIHPDNVAHRESRDAALTEGMLDAGEAAFAEEGGVERHPRALCAGIYTAMEIRRAAEQRKRWERMAAVGQFVEA